MLQIQVDSSYAELYPMLHRSVKGEHSNPDKNSGWRKPAGQASLSEVHGTVPVPHAKAGFWRQWLAFSGPAILISVGYMDPGNCGTDLPGGAPFNYGLLWVVGMASFMALILQVISALLGVATGKDLAQRSRDFYPRWTRWPKNA